jgi:hypothetical protein
VCKIEEIIESRGLSSCIVYEDISHVKYYLHFLSLLSLSSSSLLHFSASLLPRFTFPASPLPRFSPPLIQIPGQKNYSLRRYPPLPPPSSLLLIHDTNLAKSTHCLLYDILDMRFIRNIAKISTPPPPSSPFSPVLSSSSTQLMIPIWPKVLIVWSTIYSMCVSFEIAPGIIYPSLPLFWIAARTVCASASSL